MATYRVISPHGEVVDIREITSAQDAHTWFADERADYSELGWRMEVRHDGPDGDGQWHFFDDSEG